MLFYCVLVLPDFTTFMAKFVGKRWKTFFEKNGDHIRQQQNVDSILIYFFINHYIQESTKVFIQMFNLCTGYTERVGRRRRYFSAAKQRACNKIISAIIVQKEKKCLGCLMYTSSL